MSFQRRRSGLTLVELLVVLTILIILTTIAITSTDQVLDQGRYNATQRTLQNIQDAILGPTSQRTADGSLLISGFVADMGRLPQTVDTTSEPLRELWDPSVIPAASTYALQVTNLINPSNPSVFLMYPPNTVYNPTTAPVQVAVTLPCGWRGPYLQLMTGSSGRLLDGWGNPFDSLSQANSAPYTLTTMTVGQSSPLPVGQPINIVRSRGADGQVDPAPLPASFPPYNVDQYIPTQLSVPPATPLASFSGLTDGSGVLVSYGIYGNVPIVVKTFNTANQPPTLSDPLPVGPTDAVAIFFFTPVNGVLTPFGSPSFPLPPAPTPPAQALATPVAYTFAPQTANSSLNSSVTIGPRAVQAFQFDTPTGNVSKRSSLTYLMVPPGGVPTQTLILQ
jgi:type II secretory pathway pseudopilin PulG